MGADQSEKSVLVCEDCGNDFEIKKTYKSRKYPGKCRSCSGMVNAVAKKHGLGGKNRTPLYKKWVTMREMCNCVTSKDFKNYGEAGVYVCREWMKDFKNYGKWAIDNGWREGDKIERIDKLRPFRPNNCRIAKRKEEPRWMFESQMMTHKQIYDRLKVTAVSRRVFKRRMLRGWTFIKAATNAPMVNESTVRPRKIVLRRGQTGVVYGMRKSEKN